MILLLKKYFILCFVFMSCSSWALDISKSHFLNIEIDLITSYNPLLSNHQDSLAVDGSSIEVKLNHSFHSQFVIQATTELFWENEEVSLEFESAYFAYKEKNYTLYAGAYILPIAFFTDNHEAFTKNLSVYKPLNIVHKPQFGLGGTWILNPNYRLNINLSTQDKILKSSDVLLSFKGSQAKSNWSASYLFSKKSQNRVASQPSVHSGGLSYSLKTSRHKKTFFQIRTESWFTKYSKNNLSSLYSGYIFPEIGFKNLKLGFLIGYMCHLKEGGCESGLYDYATQISWSMSKKHNIKMIFETFTKRDASLVTEQSYSLRLKGEF